MKRLATLLVLAALSPAASLRADAAQDALEQLRTAAGDVSAAVAEPLGSSANPWSAVSQPAAGAPDAIGFYSAGCLKGAQPLASALPAAYQIMRPSRRRFFGHPDLLAFIAEAAGRTSASGLPLLIGDLGQPRGGPTMSGHASHQTGLDVDIWYWQPAAGTVFSDAQRETVSAPRMVVGDFEGLDPKSWQPQVVENLRSAALSGSVERILVNPVIKREVCRSYKGQAWVGKLRPWWGHEDHSHVRLRCPAASAHCKGQEPVEDGDGCGADLDSWFTPDRRREAQRQREHPEPPKMPVLPELCSQLLRE